MHSFVDVFVLGGGLAGLRAALSVDSRLSVMVVSKDELRESNSNYAQGGIATVSEAKDSFTSHIEDTLRAGGNLCDREIVEMVIRDAPERVEELVQWGTEFDKVDGSFALGREAGHQHNRILHAFGDATGREIMRSVIGRARAAENIRLCENTFTLDLLVRDGRCCGAVVWHPMRGKIIVWAKQVLLCAGGAGQVYRETTNSSVATGDGYALAFRAGVALRDMEFVQFHPTVLYIAGSSRSLITEAVRGEGAHLVDVGGYRFMHDYDDRGEMAPRDVVSQATVEQMAKTRHSNVFLQLGHLDRDFVYKRFPGMARICGEFGLDIATDRIPVRPGAHYMIGGVRIDDEGRTSLPGLWSAGEVSSSGLHGANRLASNSLLEGIVFGHRVGIAASRAALEMEDSFQAASLSSDRRIEPPKQLDLVDIRNSLQSVMWRTASVSRSGEALRNSRDSIDQWCRYVLDYEVDTPAGWETQNLLLVARMIVESALRREESRGVHMRSDFPDQDDEKWCRHIELYMDDK